MTPFFQRKHTPNAPYFRTPVNTGRQLDTYPHVRHFHI